MIRLGVNIDHVATVRQARRGVEPDPIAAAVLAHSEKLNEAALVENARIGGATPLWEWIGDEDATVFSY